MKLKTHNIINVLIAIVWIVNGLVCKVLNFVPRHQLIVAKILGQEYSLVITKLIGIAEIIMCCWVLSNYKSKLCAVTQIIVIIIMNILEFFITPDLLMFNKLNIVFASLFSLLIYANEFILKTKKS